MYGLLLEMLAKGAKLKAGKLIALTGNSLKYTDFKPFFHYDVEYYKYG